MESLLMEEKTTDISYIFCKIASTIESHSERYPELMYITSGLELVKKQNATNGNLDVLMGLSKYMKEKLSEYFVIRNLHHKFQQDLEWVKAGIDLDREDELYLAR